MTVKITNVDDKKVGISVAGGKIIGLTISSLIVMSD